MKNEVENPFVTIGYAGSEYFCDRTRETEEILKKLRNGNNLALISPRRMGKSGLIWHCFDDRAVRENYYTFYVDIYATLTLDEFVIALGKEIVGKLKSRGEKAFEAFIRTVTSLSPGISFDTLGNPTLSLLPGEIRNSGTTLEEIFRYLEGADKPCIVAIDEFQQITEYPQKNTEALLRTHIQKCRNSKFIFAGSRRHTMGSIFLSAARPFYQSVSMLNLGCIDRGVYFEFAAKHFAAVGKILPEDIFNWVYDRYEGVTWYIQKMMNTLYMNTAAGERVSADMVERARNEIVDGFSYVYLDTLYRLTSTQKELLCAIARTGKVKGLTSAKFIKANALSGASSVQSAARWLLKNDFVTKDGDCWYVYDYFFADWLTNI